jgi:FMN phosphatase YigB (HAD superfamily)
MQSPIIGISEVLAGGMQTLSVDVGVRKPSPTLFEHARDHLKELGVAPDQVLHVSHRLKEDLGPAKKVGFYTALLAADSNCCTISNSELRDPQWKPDRLITNVQQVVDIVGG